MDKIRLTQYSHGAGCGCKISPAILDKILKTDQLQPAINGLLVGNHTRDDAAVLDIGNGQAVISTTDFFMPIVDDPFTFGQIASVNAISDVYAMGGKPVMGIGILGWPINILEAELAAQVLEGARETCSRAGIPLAGGHSIDSPEPIFGLAVTGLVDKNNIKTNQGARVGDLIFITKPLGVGILTTAEKKGLLREEHKLIAKESMIQLNDIGIAFGHAEYIHALTDVTGFGLLGHLIEMCSSSGTRAQLQYQSIPKLSAAIDDYVLAGAIPGGTQRNFDSYGHNVMLEDMRYKILLADPQTSGGLLGACHPEAKAALEALVEAEQGSIHWIGSMKGSSDYLIEVS